MGVGSPSTSATWWAARVPGCRGRRSKGKAHAGGDGKTATVQSASVHEGTFEAGRVLLAVSEWGCGGVVPGHPRLVHRHRANSGTGPHHRDIADRDLNERGRPSAGRPRGAGHGAGHGELKRGPLIGRVAAPGPWPGPTRTLTPSGRRRMSFPAALRSTRRMLVAVPVCLLATRCTAVWLLGCTHTSTQ